LNFINSQYISANLTHLTPEKGYEGMKKNGIKVMDRGNNGLIYKPPGFWISVDGDWERWCISEEFRNVNRETICNVYLKPNLTFIRISTVGDADELALFLLPGLENTFHDIVFHLSDLLTFSHHHIEKIRQGIPVTPKTVWANALNSCDGIYYENSGDLHFDTFFNTWDCDSLMLFDPRHVTLLKQERHY